MSNKRITDLTELTTPTTDDVFPVVDIATNTTTKVQLANLPVQTAVTTALATKQATLVSGTNIKTVNSTTLLGSGDVAVQETLVSGTNIKTLNSVSLLGAGNIVLAATPSGVSGAIQFSNGSAFASDATNFFWDDTNNRLGVGTNAPISPLNIQSDTPNVGILSVTTSGGGLNRLEVWNTNSVSTPVWNIGISSPDTRIRMYTNITLRTNGIDAAVFSSNEASFGSISGARLGIKGSGSTSATTSLLVQNSSGTSAFAIKDDRTIDIFANTIGNQSWGQTIVGLGASGEMRTTFGVGAGFFGTWYNAGSEQMRLSTNHNLLLGTATDVASSKLTIDSTTKGFLPPRMTTTQINAIASPANGLEVYNTTLNCPCFYNGTSWRQVTNSAM